MYLKRTNILIQKKKIFEIQIQNFIFSQFVVKFGVKRKEVLTNLSLIASVDQKEKPLPHFITHPNARMFISVILFETNVSNREETLVL